MLSKLQIQLHLQTALEEPELGEEEKHWCMNICVSLPLIPKFQITFDLDHSLLIRARFTCVNPQCSWEQHYELERKL